MSELPAMDVDALVDAVKELIHEVEMSVDPMGRELDRLIRKVGELLPDFYVKRLPDNGEHSR